MAHLHILTLLLAVAAPAPSHATVTLVAEAAGYDCTGSIISVTPVCSSAADGCGGGSVASVSGDGAVPVMIPADGQYDVRVRGNRCWGSARVGEPLGFHVGVWPSSTLTATLPHEELGGEIFAAISLDGGAGRTEDRSPCEVNGRTVTCLVPATTIDVRLDVPGYAPVYRWSLRASPDRAQDIGRLELRKGASIAGWIAPAGEVKPSDVDVTLDVRSGGGAAARRVATVKPNGRGFFQFTGVEPGAYVVGARATGRAARPRSVHVEAWIEQTIAPALDLLPHSELRVVVTPPVGPEGLPWRVELQREEPGGRLLTQIDTGEADLLGLWRKADLTAGSYTVAVLDSSGSRFGSSSVSLSDAVHDVHIQVKAVAVRGRVYSGSRAVPSVLKFRSPGRQVELVSDDDGEYSGVLPEAGRWNVQVTDAARRFYVRRNVDVPEAAGEIARVDIELPPGRVRLVAGETSTGPGGEFELSLPDNIDHLYAAVLLPGVPIHFATISTGAERVRIVAGRAPAKLTLLRRPGSPWPYLRSSSGGLMNLAMLILPRFANVKSAGTRAESRLTFDVEAGMYAVCATPAADRKCELRVIAPGAHEVIDAAALDAESAEASR